MSDSTTRAFLIVVGGRFARSVSFVRDTPDSAALDGCLLTPAGQVLRLLAQATPLIDGLRSTRL